MESVPNELLNHIFGFLHPIYDNLARLSLVCKRWKAVIEKTPSLWKCIHFTRAYPFFISKDSKHREVLRHCLLKFGRYVTCLRDHPITRTFAEPSLRDILPNLSNLTCLDVPLLEWEPRFLQSLTCASTLEELNLTEYLLSEPPKLQWLFQQPDSLKKNFLTPQHLQMILLRFPRLKILRRGNRSCRWLYCGSASHFNSFSEQDEYNRVRAFRFWTHTISVPSFYSQPRYVFENDCFFSTTRIFDNAFGA